jgi:hypothetical protein
VVGGFVAGWLACNNVAPGLRYDVWAHLVNDAADGPWPRRAAVRALGWLM